MKKMSIEKATNIVNEVVAGRKRLGKQFTPRHIMDDVLDALVVVHENANLDAPSKEEITKLRRQLAAALNREKARKNKDLEPGDENDSSGGQQLELPLEDARVELPGGGTTDPNPGHSAD